MSSSKADGSDSPGWGVQELDTLAALGFGPDSPLMAEPKLFLDGAFLAALQAEMEDELGADEARITFFQIGLIHGLRDALRVSDGSWQCCMTQRSVSRAIWKTRRQTAASAITSPSSVKPTAR